MTMVDLQSFINFFSLICDYVTWPIVSVFFCTLLLCLVLTHLLDSQGKRTNLPPGPYGLPIIGNLLQLGASPHISLLELSKIYGDVFSLKLGTWQVVCVNSLDAVKEAVGLGGSSHALDGRPPMHSFEISSYGDRSCIFTSYVPLYIHNKKTVVKALHSFLDNPDRLNFLAADEGTALAVKLSQSARQPVDPIPFIKTTVINFAFRMSFGDGHGESVKGELQRLIELSVDFLENSAAGNVLDFMPWLHFALKKQAEKMKAANDTLKSFVARIYEACRDKKVHLTEKSVLAAMMKIVRKNVESGASVHLSESEQEVLKDEDSLITQLISDVFAASLETVASTLCWSLPYLVKDLALQQKLQEQMDLELGEHVQCPRIEDRQKLPLLQATVLELLRLSSVFPLGLPHFAIEEAFLRGYRIPKGTVVMLNLWAANRDQKYFEEPNKFDPYRFLDDGGQLRQDYHFHYLPFSGGARRCIGATLAKAELFLLLGAMLKKVRFGPADILPDMEGKFGLTLRPKPYRVYAWSRSVKQTANH